jgi:SAM-dependent methyltransferase
VKLDLGCGNKVREGFVGVDLHPCRGLGVACDLTAPLPFRDASVEEIWLDNVIEHVPDIPALMREIARVGATGARVTVRTPHFSSIASWRDPTHLHHLAYESLDHLEKASTAHYAGAGLRVERRRLSFGGGPFGLLGRLCFALSADFWEKHLCFVLRGGTLTWELRVVR